MAGMASDPELDALIASLDGAVLSEKIRARAAGEIGKVAKAQYAAGKGPDGSTWEKTKDGRVPLLSATSKITFQATATGISASAPDVLQYHQAKRPTFPAQGELSDPWASAATRAADAVFEETFK